MQQQEQCNQKHFSEPHPAGQLQYPTRPIVALEGALSRDLDMLLLSACIAQLTNILFVLVY